MKKIVPLVLLLLLGRSVKSQTFYYTFNSNVSPYSYTAKTTITIVGIKITQIYYDDNKASGSSGSFAYQLVINYSNTVTGTNIPSSSNFYQFQTDASSTKTGPQAAIQNNSSSIPLSTGSGNINIGNNPTFSNGSASAFGYTVGNTYTDATTLNRFGYFTLTLTVNAPGMTAQSSTQSGTILPVTITRFTAVKADNIVKVNWGTATETNSNYFTLERSETRNAFTKLANVAARGNSNTVTDYSYIDNSPFPGISYYRLKSTDIDGSISYSSTVMVNRFVNESDILTIYPNINATNIIYYQGNKVAKALDVYSVLGARLFSTTLSSNQIALPKLSKGIYILKLTATDNSVWMNKYIQQ